ncbi:MAG TPA: uracil-DNA glycosylase [Candidatus Saccharimonadales bacterium]|nr:uracil-DNA glycosylase [Candidatus Saccharimonadales bacterium]
MKRQSLLDEISKEIENCKICKRNTTGKAVAGEGNASAKIMFVGEAPGKTEAETGRPFVGRSGKLLTQLIESIGVKRQDVYITSPVKYFPITSEGKGRTPTDAEIAHGNVHFQNQLKTINPKIIVLLGKTAAKAVLGKDLPIAKVHGAIIKEAGRNYFVMYHPAAAVRFAKFRPFLQSDFKKLQRLI